MNTNKSNPMLKNELDYVAMMMQHNDPNGDYSAAELAAAPQHYIEVLEQWKEDCGTEATPKWLDKCIAYLMLLIA